MTCTTLTSTLDQAIREHAMLDVKAVATALGVTAWWVRRLINDGELRATNVGGHETSARWRVDPADLQAFIVSRENRPRDLWAAA